MRRPHLIVYLSDIQNDESLTRFILTAYTLVIFTYINLLVCMVYGLPPVYLMDHGLEYYLPVGAYSYSLAELFFVGNTSLSLVCLLNMFVGSHSGWFRWVQRLMIVVLGILSVYFSWSILS